MRVKHLFSVFVLSYWHLYGKLKSNRSWISIVISMQLQIIYNDDKIFDCLETNVFAFKSISICLLTAENGKRQIKSKQQQMLDWIRK